LDKLYAPQYGESVTLTVWSQQLVLRSDSYCAWRGKIIAPESIAGASVIVYTDSYNPGLYTLTGHLKPPVQYRNPGQGWHYMRKLCSGEIGQVSYPVIVNYQATAPTIMERVRSYYYLNLDKNLGGGNASALALALTTGDRSLLSSELKSAVYLTGVGHIMAMSGLHIGILAGLTLAGLRKIGVPHTASSLICLGFLSMYVVFAGPSPSLIRALLMSGYGVAAYIIGRKGVGLVALYWAGFLMLLYNPLWLTDYAFVFSFLAALVCIKAGSSLERILSFLPGSVRRIAAVTLIIQGTALPLNLYLFGSVSLWAPMVNTVLVPLMPFMAAASLAAGLIPASLGMLVSVPLSMLLHGVIGFLSMLGQFPLTFSVGGIKLAIMALPSVGLLLYLMGTKLKHTVIITLTCLALISVSALLAGQMCSIWFLDVGQGDAILVRDQGDWILIDSGDTYAGNRAVVPALKFLGVERLKAVVITHSHTDHGGGLDAVLENFSVEQIYSNRFLNLGDDKLPKLVVGNGTQISTNLKAYSHNIETDNVNDTSLLLSLDYKSTRLLLTGDIEEEGERLYWGRFGQYDVLKVAHHGSSTSTSEDFLARVRPQAAIISCGVGNRFGFPDQITLDKLKRVQAAVYRTDNSGCIRLVLWPWRRFSIYSFTGR